jgi:hypothetical protein
LSEDNNIKQLLREGVEAARAGDKETARARFEQVTELDENNENAWLWLATVVDTDEEKRVCLSNVLVINPANEKAQKMMDKLQDKKRQQAADEEVIPGVSRRQLLIIGGGGGVVILLLIALFVTSTVSTNNARAAETASARRLYGEQTSTSAAIALVATSNAETQIAQQSTPTPTPRSNVLPPTFTPTPTWTPQAGEQAIITPPPSIPGTIVMWGGRDSLSNGALALFAVPANASVAPSQIGTDLGRDVRFTAVGQRVVYTFYDSALFTFGLQAINLNGTQLQPINPRLPDALILNVEQPDYCTTANRIVHVGVPEVQLDPNNIQFGDDRPPTKVFITDVDAGATIQITTDTATYSYPAFSPDCDRIAVVRNDENTATPGADIVIIDIANGTQTPVTTDLDTFTETTPRWSPDGTQIFYAAALATSPNNHDIAYTNADGTGSPLLPVRDEFDTVFPVVSPDGQYLAYASNRSGRYQIYIQSLADSTVWQLTNGDGSFYPGGWR